MVEKFIVTNFAYGTGPYLRTTELAIAVNDELEKRGLSRMPVIIPLVYGEKQKKIMLEEFSEIERHHPGELLFDAQLGTLLRSVFYHKNSYAEALTQWSYNVRELSEATREHLSGSVVVETLSGRRFNVNGSDIALELSRSPRVLYDIAPAYMTTFGYVAEILTHAKAHLGSAINLSDRLVSDGILTAEYVESRARMRVVGYPATFSGSLDYKPNYSKEILSPPLTSQFPEEDFSSMQEGIMVTVTGIPGLERLYKEAREIGLILYSNDPLSVQGSIQAYPKQVTNKAIKLQFARSGWGSIWLSMFCGTPIVVPEYDPNDDPEIYFNNIMVEKLGLGIIYRGQSLGEILSESDKIRQNYVTMRERIFERWGTLDGNRYCAKLFVDDYVGSNL